MVQFIEEWLPLLNKKIKKRDRFTKGEGYHTVNLNSLFQEIAWQLFIPKVVIIQHTNYFSIPKKTQA